VITQRDDKLNMHRIQGGDKDVWSRSKISSPKQYVEKNLINHASPCLCTSRRLRDKQFPPSPEDGSVEVVCVRPVDGVQVAGGGQLGCELAPGHLQDLVGDVSLHHLDKMLHLVPVQLQLVKL